MVLLCRQDEGGSVAGGTSQQAPWGFADPYGRWLSPVGGVCPLGEIAFT